MLVATADGGGSPDPAMLGTWLQVLFYCIGGFAGVLGCILALKKIFEPKDVTEQAVTRKELESLTAGLLTYATRAEVSRLEISVRDLQEYTRDRLHAIANSLHPIELRLQRIDILLRLLSKKNGIDFPSPESEPPLVLGK